MFGSPEYLVMRLQEQVARVILPGFAASSAAALVQFLRTGEVSVANNVMEDFLMLVHLLEIFPPLQVCQKIMWLRNDRKLIYPHFSRRRGVQEMLPGWRRLEGRRRWRSLEGQKRAPSWRRRLESRDMLLQWSPWWRALNKFVVASSLVSTVLQLIA